MLTVAEAWEVAQRTVEIVTAGVKQRDWSGTFSSYTGNIVIIIIPVFNIPPCIYVHAYNAPHTMTQHCHKTMTGHFSPQMNNITMSTTPWHNKRQRIPHILKKK